MGLLVVRLLPCSVFAVVARKVFNHALALEHKSVIHCAVHEKAVVAHHYHAAVEFA